MLENPTARTPEHNEQPLARPRAQSALPPTPPYPNPPILQSSNMSHLVHEHTQFIAQPCDLPPGEYQLPPTEEPPLAPHGPLPSKECYVSLSQPANSTAEVTPQMSCTIAHPNPTMTSITSPRYVPQLEQVNNFATNITQRAIYSLASAPVVTTMQIRTHPSDLATRLQIMEKKIKQPI